MTDTDKKFVRTFLQAYRLQMSSCGGQLLVALGSKRPDKPKYPDLATACREIRECWKIYLRRQ